MNCMASGVLNPALAGAAASGLLYHMARDYNDGAREYTAHESFASMVGDEYIEAQGNKGYFARVDDVKSVSFTGSSIARLSKLVSRRSEFGICFERRMIDPFGTDIRPVHYLSQAVIDRIRNEGIYPERLTAEDRYWIDLNEPGKYAFSWEEEWRKLGDFMFDHDSVVFLIVPTLEIGARFYALGYHSILSAAIRDPVPHLARLAWLVDEARKRAPAHQKVDEAAIEDSYLVWLAYRQSEAYGDFYPKIRADMNRDVESAIFTDSGEIRDPDGELNYFEAASFDLDNQLYEYFEDRD